MKHPYEYRLIQKWITASIVPDYTDEQVQSKIGEQFDIAADSIASAIDERTDIAGWMVNSHSLIFIGKAILLSLLLQRPIIETS